LNAIEKDYTTRKGFLNLTKTLIEEGITSLDQFNVRTSKIYNPPIQCGLITGITKNSFFGFYDQKELRWKGGVKYDWASTGLLSRFVPFSYEYELTKIGRIFSALESISRLIGGETGSYGFRMQRNLQALARANAVLNDRSKVAQEDIDQITHLANWANYRNNPL
jgi:hypothetical protein